MEMATIGPGVAGGSNRQALSDEDAAGRQLFSDWARAAGCELTMDRIGNLFARRPGRDPDRAPVMTGSHLDTQPTGGRFDGVYGVLAGLEVIERMNDLGVETAAPIEVVVWTNEEGSRFPHSTMGSSVWAGTLDLEGAYGLADESGVTVGDELQRLGWVGELPAAPRDLGAYVELHIEQGPILEDTGAEIGVVTAGQGYRWYQLELRGFPAHAGPTPMEGRRDPAQALAQLIGHVHAAAAELAPWARSTFAQFSSEPRTPNTICEVVRCTLDLRHPDGDTLDELERRLRSAASEAGERFDVEVDVELLSAVEPVTFDPDVVDVVRTSAEHLALRGMDIVSGAGHDACQIAGHAPTAMIFVPCKDGVSHNEAEDITPTQAEQGLAVLYDTLTRLSR